MDAPECGCKVGYFIDIENPDSNDCISCNS